MAAALVQNAQKNQDGSPKSARQNAQAADAPNRDSLPGNRSTALRKHKDALQDRCAQHSSGVQPTCAPAAVPGEANTCGHGRRIRGGRMRRTDPES